MAHRLEILQNHLSGAEKGKIRAQVGLEKILTTLDQSSQSVDSRTRNLIAMLEDRAKSPETEKLIKELHGPMQHEMTHEECLLAHMIAVKDGQNHRLYEDWCRKYGGKIGSNIALMTTIMSQEKGEMPYHDVMVIIGNPQDARRIARMHVKKSKAYGVAFLGNGVLSTRDNEDWKAQRQHLSESFMPMSGLSHIFPISRDRAEYAVIEKLDRLSESGRKPVEINEFLLYEAMAQLQLALLGETEEYMMKTNVDLRKSFAKALTVSGDGVQAFKSRSEGRKYVQEYAVAALGRGTNNSYIKGVSEAVEEGHPEMVNGPLMARIADNTPHGEKDPKVDRDNAATFLFAGHDTTANLMTHFTYEMAKRPVWQKKLQNEVDAMFDKVKREKRKLEYADLKDLKVMKNCINEVLRLWPSVPNGTFREFQYDDEIMGADGKLVTVKKGTNCTISPWLLHRNEELWGEDVNDFNPDRDWKPEEEWFGHDMWATNPESDRYAPFTHPPRDCMGKNFAQMEARIILSYMFHLYNVELAPPTKGLELYEISINNGTFGKPL